MTSDTIKSLGYLRKSLRMSRRAIERNQPDDKTTNNEVNEMRTKIDAVISHIAVWENKVLADIVTGGQTGQAGQVDVSDAVDQG